MLNIRTLSAALILAVLSACMPQKNLHPDVYGHRGCRGLLPENTIRGFREAVEMGCDFVEMDVVISKDGQVIVSHEPWMDHTICLNKDGTPISEAEERRFNIYQMTVKEIQKFDCGSLEHPRFPDQDQRKSVKPTLREVVEDVDELALMISVGAPSYNIEIKSDPALYGTFQPDPKEFAHAVIETVDSLGLAERCIIQSFDPAILEAVHAEHHNLITALLVENKLSVEENLARLTFKPNIYSPHFSLANEALLKTLREKDIELIVWTVNDESDIKRMLNLGVDAIISDYPDRVIKLIEDH